MAVHEGVPARPRVEHGSTTVSRPPDAIVPFIVNAKPSGNPEALRSQCQRQQNRRPWLAVTKC